MMGIQTIGDLAKTPLAALKARWGVNGEVIWRIANGLDDSPVSLNAHEQQKGIGHQMTLPRDYAKLEEIYVVIMELSELVCERARRQGKMGKVVAVGVQGSDFDNPQGFYRQRKLDTPTNITKKVYEAARALFKEHWDHKEGRYAIRKVGVTLQDLVPADVYQLDLFEDLPKITALEQTTDALKDRYGETVIMRASSLTEAGQIRDRSRKIGGHYK
jgi:DNA polymerase-4